MGWLPKREMGKGQGPCRNQQMLCHRSEGNVDLAHATNTVTKQHRRGFGPRLYPFRLPMARAECGATKTVGRMTLRPTLRGIRADKATC